MQSLQNTDSWDNKSNGMNEHYYSGNAKSFIISNAEPNSLIS